MSTSQTPNYGLHQWAGEDQFKRAEFNEDNARLDAALHSLRGDVDAKAAQTALDALSATVGKKADQTALDALSAAVGKKADQTALNALSAAVDKKADQTALSALSAAVSGKGNCRIVAGSYIGNGDVGPTTPTRLTFDGKPLLVVVGGGNVVLIMTWGSTAGNLGGGNPPAVSWGSNSVSWYGNSDILQLSRSGATYRYLALMLSE